MSDFWSKEEEVQRLQRRFDSLKATEKVSQAAFARANSMPGGASMITQHLKMTRPISMEHALVYAKGFKCSLGEISPRLAKLAADGHATINATLPSLLASATGGPTIPGLPPVATQPHPATGVIRLPIDLDNNPDYPAIRRVAIKAQAGVSGYAIEYMNDDGPPIVFRSDWYKAKGYRPEKMLAVRVCGESMIPSLYEGDLIVINTEQTQPKQGVTFLVSYEGEVVVKRMVRDDGLWWLTSDNPDQRRYPRTKCNGGTTIIGEVVYRQTERV